LFPIFEEHSQGRFRNWQALASSFLLFSVLDAAAAAKGENVLAVWFSGSMGSVDGMGWSFGWPSGGWCRVGRSTAQQSTAHNPQPTVHRWSG